MREARDLLRASTSALGAMHRHQVHRDPWPDFDAFRTADFPPDLRREAAWQWTGRAQAEHGSVHQFSAVARALSELCAPIELLGAIARLITDEVRHVELCARAALAFHPDGDAKFYRWRRPRAPWPDAPVLPPDGKGTEMQLRGWAARAIVTACCLGETLSKPMLDAVAVVSTDALPRDCANQILLDERFHASFGWEAARVLVADLDDAELATLQTQLAKSFAGFERTTCGGVTVEDLAEREIVIEPGDPNLGTLSYEQFAVIFFSTLEHEIFPKLRELGLDPDAAWVERMRYPRGPRSDVAAESARVET